MKLAVILGILQMSLGIIVKCMNSVHFKKYYDLCFECIPSLIQLIALFGWMDILIIGKWLSPKDIEYLADPVTQSKEYNKVHLAPPIITVMIDMFLNFGSNEQDDADQIVLKYNYTYEG